MRTLSKVEVESVTGGFLPIIIIAAIVLTGCGQNNVGSGAANDAAEAIKGGGDKIDKAEESATK